MFFDEMAWAGSSDASGPFNFRGCDLTARIPPRHGGCPGAIPGNRTNLQIRRAPACAAESPKLEPAWGSTKAACQSSYGVVADKQCTCPASRPMRERYPPTPPAFARRSASGYGSANQQSRSRSSAKAAVAQPTGRSRALLASAQQAIFHCGELDQSTEPRLITAYRRV